MISLSNSELAAVMEAARPIPPRTRVTALNLGYCGAPKDGEGGPFNDTARSISCDRDGGLRSKMLPTLPVRVR